VIVLAGAGRSFSSGADLDTAADGASVSDAPADMIRNRARVEAWLSLWSAPKPLIAQVHGWCLGTANELAGACDLVVCGESAKLGMPEVRHFALPPTLGFWPCSAPRSCSSPAAT
jgi:enoyl-CoA hydratase